MEDYLFTCDDCGNKWKGSEYDEDTDESSDYHDGAICPKCKSESIGGVKL